MSKIKVLVVVVAIVALAGTFYILKTSENDHQRITAPSEQRFFSIDIIDGRLASDDNTLNVQQNDTVTIKASANKTDELHLHGYGKPLKLQPGKVDKMTFVADMAGRFEAELHSDGSPIFALEVQPK